MTVVYERPILLICAAIITSTMLVVATEPRQLVTGHDARESLKWCQPHGGLAQVTVLHETVSAECGDGTIIKLERT